MQFLSCHFQRKLNRLFRRETSKYFIKEGVTVLDTVTTVRQRFQKKMIVLARYQILVMARFFYREHYKEWVIWHIVCYPIYCHLCSQLSFFSILFFDKLTSLIRHITKNKNNCLQLEFNLITWGLKNKDEWKWEKM